MRSVREQIKGELDEGDTWLLGLSRVIRQEPKVLERTLYSRQPGIQSFEKNCHRLEYITGLCRIEKGKEEGNGKNFG